MTKDVLKQFGLSSAQAEVYGLLLDLGKQKAGELAKKATIKRGLVYKALEELEKIGLIERLKETGKPDYFLPKHPENMRSFIEDRMHQARDAEVLFSSHIGELSSHFALATGKPGVRNYDGLEGLKLVYKEINEKYDHFKLMRSFYDHADKEVTALVERQMKRQIEKNIESQVLTHVTPKAIEYALAYRENKSLHNPHFITDEKFKLPAQIAIYGNKVAITDFPSMLITTIIENKAIKDTFETIFDFMWRKAEENHEKVLGKYAPTARVKMNNPNFK